jgi:hypothetical protein
MHTFKFTLLVALGYVAMIGAIPLEDSSPVYVPLITARGGSDPIGNIFPTQLFCHSSVYRMH